MNLKEKEKITLSLIETFNKAGNLALDLRLKGLKKEIKSDNTPVSNGDIEVNKILTNKIQEITPNITIVSEESNNHKSDNDLKNFWLIDPIDGTRDYINNRDEFTLNAALILNKKPSIGIITAPAKGRFFYSYGLSNSYELIDGNQIPLMDKEKNYKELQTYIWNKVVGKIQCILDKHNMQAYDNDNRHYIEMTLSTKLHRLYSI